MFILNSIFSSLEFWSVNHNPIHENSELKVFKKIKYFGEIQKNIFACLFSVHTAISLSRHEQVCLVIGQMISQKQMYIRLVILAGNRC